MRFPAPRRLATTSVLMIGALGAGVAFAAWTANGTGTASDSSLTAQTLTVTARTGTADLYPGFTDGDLTFTVTNTNPYPVRFTSAAFTTVTSSDTTACPSLNVTTDATATGLTLDVPANSSGTNLAIPDVVNMIAAAPDGCQNKNFTVALTLAGSQN